MCDEVTIASQLLEITKKLTENNVNFSINMNFNFKDNDFNFSASSSRVVQDSPAIQKKRKRKSPSQMARNLKRLVEHKEKMMKKLEITTSSDSSNVTLSGKDDSSEPVVSCDLCDHRTKTEHGLKQHKRKKHEVSQIDGNDSVSEENLKEETSREHCEDSIKNKNEDISDTVNVVNEIDGSKAKKNETTTFVRDELWCWKCEEEQGPTLDRWLYQFSNKPAMKAHMHQITIFEDIDISKHGGFKYYAY